METLYTVSFYSIQRIQWYGEIDLGKWIKGIFNNKFIINSQLLKVFDKIQLLTIHLVCCYRVELNFY